MSQQKLYDSLATELRISQRLLQETAGGIRRSGWMNIVIAVTMASILSIFGTLTLLVLDSQYFVGSLGTNVEISVYLKDQINYEDMRKDLAAVPNVSNLKPISKQKAWEELKEQYDISDSMPNPLPDTVRVKVTQPSLVDSVAENLKKVAGVEAIQYPKRVLSKFQELSQNVSVFGFAFTSFLGFLTLFIISNTITLLIQARGREIEILRMMGVGNWYIRLPFLLQGAVYGLFGSLLAFIPVVWVQGYIQKAFDFFLFTEGPNSIGFVLLLMLLMGIFVGAGGAAISIHRYLKV